MDMTFSELKDYIEDMPENIIVAVDLSLYVEADKDGE